MSHHFTSSPIVQVIHTIKGRARYKVNGLYGSQSLKEYLELKLAQEYGISQVRANPRTGNVLVLFEQYLSPDKIAYILKTIILNYRPQLPKTEVLSQAAVTFVETNGKYKVSSVLVMKRLLDKQLTWVWGTIGTLTVATGVLHYYKLDRSILLLIQKLHTPLFDRIMIGTTFFGEPLTLVLICLGVVMSPLSKRFEKAATLSIATLGAVGLNCWLKVGFGRVRPALWERIIHVRHFSFPSGHAMMSIVTYGFISYLLAQRFPRWREQIYTLSLVVIVAIGFSRLYLGVHWPTDVLAGYGVGLLWLMCCILYLEIWQAKDNLLLTGI